MFVVLSVVLSTLFTGCTGGTDDTPPPTSSTTPSDSPLPADFPEDTTVTPGNTHLPFGSWGIVSLDDDTVAGVRLNNVWQGTAGLLRERMVTATPDVSAVDLAVATPFFISWSYRVVSGDPESIPALEAMPGLEGTLWRVSSAYSDRDCPDYEPSIERGIGLEVRHCLVVVSADGATPRALIVKVPGERMYWFFDPPDQFAPLQPE
ncbi:MAG: hypothetical protein LBC29_02655 [Propionibacteriaceae bacterium]|nr:hypothetical protein [Propionibacteriaceae bacterium]